jgi:hypothetical protein
MMQFSLLCSSVSAGGSTPGRPRKDPKTFSQGIIGCLRYAGFWLVLVAFAWHFTHVPKNPLVPASTGGGNHLTTQSVGDFDQFQQDLADRGLKQYGGGKDFSVIVATTAYPLGTLLRSTGSVPADLEDCVLGRG